VVFGNCSFEFPVLNSFPYNNKNADCEKNETINKNSNTSNTIKIVLEENKLDQN